jgi:ketosteroid isomerase-like protein
MSDPGDATPAGAVIDALRDLFDAIIRRDVDVILSRYVQDDRLLVFVEGPPGRMVGWDEAFARGAWLDALEHAPFERLELGDDLRFGESGGLAWAAATVEWTVVVDGVRREGTNRGTWVLERSDDQWRILCEHVSFETADPYGATGLAKRSEGEFATYCPSCETWVSFGGRVIVATDGTTGAQGPCPACGTVVTAMLLAPRQEA